jgi:uncharacterized membrane protein YkoI
MKKSMKFLVLGLILGAMISVGAVYAANNIASTKPANKSVAAAPVAVKVKLTRRDAAKIALAAHKNARILNIRLKGKIYIVKIQSKSGNRTLRIGGNTGKILKDTVSRTQK